MQGAFDGDADVTDVEKVPGLAAGPIDHKRLSGQRPVDEQGDHARLVRGEGAVDVREAERYADHPEHAGRRRNTLAVQLGGAVGRQWRRSHVLPQGWPGPRENGAGGREDERPDARTSGGVDHCERPFDVDAEIDFRMRHRVGHPGLGGEVHNGVHVLRRAPGRSGVLDAAQDRLGARPPPPPRGAGAGREIIQDAHVVPARL